MIEITTGTLDDLKDIYKKLRAEDRAEMERNGATEAGLEQAYKNDIMFVARIEGKAIAVFGMDVRDRAVQVWLLGTDEVNKHVVFMTRWARGFLYFVKVTYPGYSILVFKSKQDRKAIEWLKRLGFYEYNDYGKTVFLEYRECQQR